MNDIRAPLVDEFEEDLSSLVDSRAAPHAAAPDRKSAEALPPPLAALVKDIEPPSLMVFVRGLFTDTLKLLGQVRRVRAVVEGGAGLGGLPRVFTALRKSSGYLLTNLETAELRVEALPDALAETLEAAVFALGHELRRVFEKELMDVADHPERRRDVLRVCAILENCYEQLTISLARIFDAGVSGASLFESHRRRRQESVQLRAELRALLAEVQGVEKAYSALSGLALLKRVRRFRDECLHHLMYRDWEDFERFADALELSYESDGEMRVLTHKLSCYLEALLNQVEMRTVLAEDG